MAEKLTAAYLRISTDKKQKVDSQLADIKDYCANHGIEATYYVDEGFSGSNTDRPEFKRLQEDVFKGRVETIIVSRIDRISRKASDGIKIFDNWLADEIKVISVNEAISFEGPTGDLTRKLLQILAEWDSAVRRERALQGIAVAKEKNPEKYSGRKTGAYTVDSDKILKLRAKRFSIASIASTLDVGKSTVVNHIDRNAAKDVEEALVTMGEQNNLIGSFNLTYDFHDGLTGTYAMKGTDPEIMPKSLLSGLMKASKKWYPIYWNEDQELYQKLMTRLAYQWYENIWSSFNIDNDDMDSINPDDVMARVQGYVTELERWNREKQ